MNKYGIYDDAGLHLFDLHSENFEDALSQARAIDRRPMGLAMERSGIHLAGAQIGIARTDE